MNPPLLPHVRALHPTFLPHLPKTATLAVIGVLSLGVAATVAVTAVQEHDAQTALISTLGGTLDDLGDSVSDVRSATTLDLNQVAEYRALILEQDAAFASVEGFIQ